MKTTSKQKLTSDLLNAGFTKKDFTLKKVGGFLTLIVEELKIESFKIYSLCEKYNVDFQFQGCIYGSQAIYKQLGLTCDITKLC